MCDDESSVRVAVRIRPQIAREKIEMCRVCTNVTPNEPQVWLGSDKAFTYDYVFDMDSTQDQIYSYCVENLIDGCFDGYNATVLAYGQTGSGKTYTMGTGLDIETVSETLGIIPRAVIHLFNGIDHRRSVAKEQELTPPEFKITTHFMELYNEEIIDLFDSDYKGIGKTGVKIHEDPEGGIYVGGVTTKTLTSVDDALQCLRSGALSRTTASTNMNTHSSRSHAIFTLIIKQQRISVKEDLIPVGENDVPEFETLTAKFHFVDLAGSERLKRTGATGERAREGISINCGLLALGNVISALGDLSKKALHVPYRDSKLTRLLQDSLGGNSRTLMIACVSPSDTDFMETLNTLKYANRARNIKNRVTVNQDKTSKMVAVLRQQIQELQVELMEYKQGKRIVSADGTEGVNDMFHENQMLLTESEHLRTRIKALQETVEVLSAKNSQLLAEKASGDWGSEAKGGESTMAEVVHNYIKEIEELRAKLCESEHMCEQLRKQRNNLNNSPMARASFSPMHGVTMAGSFAKCIDDEAKTITELIEEAKMDLKDDLDEISRIKSKPEDGAYPAQDNDNDSDNEYNGDNDEEDSSDDNEEKENYNAELADLTSEISIKQRLIESLEASQRRLETMKLQYEEKLTLMMNKIKATQVERDQVLDTIRQSTTSTSGSDERVKSVRQEYQKKLSVMEDEVKKLRTAQKEHSKLMRERSAHERQLKTLKNEMAEMKRNKVKLINKMKEESSLAKKEDLKKNKEIAQLRKEQRKKENYIRSLEADNRLKTNVLKRKTEEISNLKRVPRRNLNNRVAGRVRTRLGNTTHQQSFSPKVAKHKWQSLEQSINKVAYNKQTVCSLERDMDRWLKERESLSRQLERLKRRRERTDPSNITAYNDLNDQMDACAANIDYIHENISECQENIMSIEENRETADLLDSSKTAAELSMDEMQYMISKLISMSINQATLSAQKQAEMCELEGKMKQMEQTMSVQEQLLAHVLKDNDMNVYHLMSSLVAAEEHTSGSTESSRSGSPVEGMPDTCPSVDYSCDSLRRNEKARSKTATTEDMLFNSASSKAMSASTTALNGVVVGSGHEVASLSAPSTLDPRMTTSLEGNSWTSRRNNFERQIGVQDAFLHPNQFPRPTADSTVKTIVANWGSKNTPSLTRKSYEKRDSPSKRPNVCGGASPGKARKRTPVMFSSMFSCNGATPVETTCEVTPPSSPAALRRNISREENVFNRLTSTTSSFRGTSSDSGIINPHSGKVNSRSILACTHIAQGHAKAVLSVCATDDRIFSASKDQTVKVWDLSIGQEIQSLGGHPNNVNCVKYSEVLNLCYSVSSSFIKVWDLRENPSKCIKTLTSSGLTSSGATSFATNGRTLEMPSGEKPIYDIALSKNSHMLYSAAGNIVRTWDLRKFMCVGKLSGGHQAAVMCLAVESSRNQDVVVTGSKDHYIKIFDVGSSNSALISAKKSLNPPHYDGVQSLSLYDNVLFSGSRDMCIKKWNLNKGELVQSLNNAHKDWICTLCFLPGGQIVLSGCRGGMVKMWSVDSCRLLGELRAHTSDINAITTNSSCIFTASSDGKIGLWRMRTSYDVSPEMSDSAC